MNDALLACGSALVAFLVHVALWRARMPTHTTRALIVIFAAVLVVALVLRALWLQAYDWGGALYVVALYGALALSYILLYTGIECDSPTLSLCRYIASSGSGVTEAELDAFIASRPFVMSRIAQLEQAGFVSRRSGTIELTRNSTFMLAVTDLHRRLMGRLVEGG